MHILTKEAAEKLLHAKNYIEAVLNDWEASDDYDELDHEPTFHLTAALEELEKVFITIDEEGEY